MENFKNTNPPTFSQKKETNPMLAICFGIVSVVMTVLAHLFWGFYFFAIGFAVFSMIEAIKYFKVEKIQLIASMVAISASMIVGYNVLTSVFNGIRSLFTVQATYYESYEPDYNDYFDYFNSDNGNSYWD